MLVCWVHSRVTVAPHVAAVRTGGRSHGGRAGLPERPNCGESSFRKCPSLSCHREAVEPGAEDCSYLLGSTTTEKRAEEPEPSSVPTNPAGPLTMLLYSKIPVTRDSPKGCSNCPAIFKETEYQTNGSHGWISLLVPKPFQSPEHFFFPNDSIRIYGKMVPSVRIFDSSSLKFPVLLPHCHLDLLSNVSLHSVLASHPE